MATYVAVKSPGSKELLTDGTIVVKGGSAVVARIVAKMFGAQDVDRQAIEAVRLGALQDELSTIRKPSVEYTLNGEPEESSPGVWSVRFVAYVRDAG